MFFTVCSVTVLLRYKHFWQGLSVSYAALVTLLMAKERGSGFGNYIVSLKSAISNRRKKL